MSGAVIMITVWWLQNLGRLPVSIQAAQKFDVGGFSLRKLSELEVRKEYQIKISTRSAGLENLNDSEDINRAWENIKENIKTSFKESLGLYELKKHKPWFDEECSRFLDQRKQAKMQRLQDPNKSNVHNLKNVRREARKQIRNKKKEYMEFKIDNLKVRSKILGDMYRGKK
jgi:hypothetical protein